MTRRRFATAAAAVGVALLALTGCGGAYSDDDTTTPVSGTPLEVVEVTTPAGETVTCVWAGSYRGGIDCDWEGAR